MNPRACHETKMPILPAVQKKNLAVVGAGPAGLAFAINAAARGHQVTLFAAHSEIGGQFNIAKLRVHIPGKLSRIKGMNCGLYHNIKSAFNRVYILFPGKRLGLPVYGVFGG